jgi:hypothetical protein
VENPQTQSVGQLEKVEDDEFNFQICCGGLLLYRSELGDR